MQHCAIPNMHRYCRKFTWYALGTYWGADKYVLGIMMYLYPGHSLRHSCTEYILVCTLAYKYVLGMYLDITAFASEPCFTGFQGVLRDANKLVPDV